MFNYRSNQQGIRPGGGSYFRTPPGQRPQRQSFNRPIQTTNKSDSNKSMGSKPPQVSPTGATRQSDPKGSLSSQSPQGQESKSVFSRPAVEQPAIQKLEDKTADSPVVQQASSQSSFKSFDTKAGIADISPEPPSNPPVSDSPPPLPPTVQAPSRMITGQTVESSKEKKSMREDEISWSPPPPETQQKPVSIPLSSEATQRESLAAKQVPFGAALTHKTQVVAKEQGETKDTSPLSAQNDHPFQSQFIKGYQTKKPPFKQNTMSQSDQQKNVPPQESATYSESNPNQQPQGSYQFGKRRFGAAGKWGKNEKSTFRRSDPSPMQIEYELDPKIDRSILESEPKENYKKFTNRCRLFVGGIPNADEKLLKDMFIKFGAISELWLNKEKGFGFVKMDTRANAQRSIDHYNGIERLSTMVRVRFAARNSAIKVSNLSFAVTNELLEEAFKTFGEVENAVVACDERGKSLGWGVVDFAMKKSATLATARCKEGIFLLCRSPIPVMVSELRDEDLEEGVVEKTIHKNILYQREREESPRFAMPGSMEYQMGLKWKAYLEKARSDREGLEEILKGERIKLEDETEADLVRYLEEQDFLRHQEELRRMDEAKRNDESKRQDYLRQQEMIKQESRRRNQSMKMQEDLHRREETLHREGEFMPVNEDRGYNRQFGQTHQSAGSYGYSQDYEHGYRSNKPQDWQQSGSSYQKDWAAESESGYGAAGYHVAQARGSQSGYEEYPGYSSHYEQAQQGGNQYGGDSYSKGQFGSGDQYRGDSRGSGSGYAGYSGGNTQSGGDEYRGYSSAPSTNVAADNYSSDRGYGSSGYGSSATYGQAGSGDRSWSYGQSGQSGGNRYEGSYGDQYGSDQTGGGSGYDRRRPLAEDLSTGRMAGYPIPEKRRKL